MERSKRLIVSSAQKRAGEERLRKKRGEGGGGVEGQFFLWVSEGREGELILRCLSDSNRG